MIFIIIIIRIYDLFILWPDQVKQLVGSSQITHVNQHWAWAVFKWVITWEYWVFKAISQKYKLASQYMQPVYLVLSKSEIVTDCINLLARIQERRDQLRGKKNRKMKVEGEGWWKEKKTENTRGKHKNL